MYASLAVFYLLYICLILVLYLLDLLVVSFNKTQTQRGRGSLEYFTGLVILKASKCRAILLPILFEVKYSLSFRLYIKTHGKCSAERRK
jgi:hypothetical protein